MMSWSRGRARLLTNVGVRTARSQDLGTLRLGSEALVAVALSARLDAWIVGAELDGSTGLREGARLRRAETSLEARALVERELGALGRPRVAVGTGLLDGWGTPSWRVVVGWSFAFGEAREAAAPPRRSPRDLTTSEGDRDHDGIADARDRCVSLAEDDDGVLDVDGCPEGFVDRLPAPPPSCEPVRLEAHFAVDVDRPSASSAGELREALARLGGSPFRRLRLVGNDALSSRRIEAVLRIVADELEALPRVTRWPRGEREPVVPSSDPVARARNRRVELHFECR
jgi:hypothetical protein